MLYILLANGFEDIEAFTVIDILKRANLTLKPIGVNNHNIKSSSDINITLDKTLDEINIYDDEIEGVILPGGYDGVKNLENEKKVKDFLTRINITNRLIACICAAPKIIGQMGLLNGKNAICYPGFEKFLTGANIVNENVVLAENIITSKGPSTAFDFAFLIVKYFKPEIVGKLTGSLLF